MMKLLKYEIENRKMFLIILLGSIMGAGVLSLLFSTNKTMAPELLMGLITLVMVLIVSALFMALFIFSIINQSELWTKKGTLLYSIPVNRFKIFNSKLLVSLGVTVLSFAIWCGFAVILLNKFNFDWSTIKEILPLIEAELIIVTVLSIIGQYLYWLIGILFVIVLSKTVLGHSKHGVWAVPVIAITILFVLPTVVSLIGTIPQLDMYVNMDETAVNNGLIQGTMSIGDLLPRFALYLSLIYHWVGVGFMYIFSGKFLNKSLNV